MTTPLVRNSINLASFPLISVRLSLKLLAALVSASFCLQASAATFTIADGDVAALKAAIATANSNGEDDTIELAANGSYSLTAVDNTFNGDNGLPQIDSDGGKKLAIHGNGATIQRSSDGGTPAFRIFYINSDADLTISQLTIANGKASASYPGSTGGGIYNDHGTVAAENSTFNQNSATDLGGGIFNDGHASGSATLTISNSTFSQNSATNGGASAGAIFNDGVHGNATLTISNSTFTENYATDGAGGIYNLSYSGSATLTISNSTFSHNSTNSGGGGGIINAGSQGGGSATVSITNSTFSQNSVTFGSAGAIYNSGQAASATLTISNSTFSQNAATNGSAGAIFNRGYDGSGTLSITNSTFSQNSAYDGGVIYNQGVLSGSATVSITNSTFNENSAQNGGGAVNYSAASGSATLQIGNTILKTGASGENISNNAGTVTSLGYNLSNDAAGGFLNQPTDQVNTDPILDPAGLQNNGGPTQTITLQPGSPAIDKGKDLSGAGVDQRGFVRPFDDPNNPNANGGDGSDIGAVELQFVTIPGPTYSAQIQPPINADGTSVFNVRRGVVPVKFTLRQDGTPTCTLPPATIAVTRTAGGTTGAVNESVYTMSADSGSNFRIDGCQYIYNLNSGALGVGTYRVDIKINGNVVGSGIFQLK